jgi:hypothetical protein
MVVKMVVRPIAKLSEEACGSTSKSASTSAQPPARRTSRSRAGQREFIRDLDAALRA